MIDVSPAAANANEKRADAAALRFAVSKLDWLKAKVDRLEQLEEPVRREVRFGGASGKGRAA